MKHFGYLLLPILLVACSTTMGQRSGWEKLFAKDGIPDGWVARAWDDVKKEPPQPVKWHVVNGVLHGGEPRGTWLVSEREYGDFILEYEFKLGERGNSGLGLRFPAQGDPAFDGLELQMADFRYNTNATIAELTGGLYRALAPKQQVYKPLEWNKYIVTLKGSHVHAVLNGVVIQDVDLKTQTDRVKRHDGSLAPALKDRPLRGHIGFQELSRSSDNPNDVDHVQIRNARIKVLD
jgi:hypothetical protein